jgi:arylsulfatase A-like enzyme
MTAPQDLSPNPAPPPSLGAGLREGLRVGLAVGVGQTLGATLVAFLALGRLWGQSNLHKSLLPSGLVAWTLLASALGGLILGGLILGGLLGERAARRPSLVLLGLGLGYGAVAALGTTFILVQLSVVFLGLLFAALLLALGRRAPRLTAALAAAPIAALLIPRPIPIAPLIADAPASPAPNVLWVVLDTVRADHTGPGGYGRATTPRLSALAAEGVTFERAYSTASWTLPAHASMFTGRSPTRHGCHDQTLRLGEALPTVAERLSEAGYMTALLSSNPWVGADTGLGRGFGHILDAWRWPLSASFLPVSALLRPWRGEDKGAHLIAPAARRWLDQRPEDRPFFLVVNLMEAHDPYHELATEHLWRFTDNSDAVRSSREYSREVKAPGVLPSPSPEQGRDLVDLYDAGIFADDATLGALLDELAARGLLESTLVIVTADHGESLGDAGRWGHHLTPDEEVLRVPLVMRLPSALPAGARVDAPVSLVDLTPTVLDLLPEGLIAPMDGLDGRSVLPLLASGAPWPVFAEVLPPDATHARGRVSLMGYDPDTFRWQVVIHDGDRLTRGPNGDLLERVGAPDEAQGLDEAARAAQLGALLDAQATQTAAPTGPAAPLDPATRARLRALGYAD